MKRLLTLLVLTTLVFSCKEKEKETAFNESESQEQAYSSYGEEISTKNVLSSKMITEQFGRMSLGDTVAVKMTAKVDEVCQAKGCWMKLKLDNDEQVMVKFKDYGFFMPKDIAGQEVIINGKAYVNEVPVDEQRHYAEDGGATAEEIAAITAPKKTYSFEADGVLIKQ